MRPVPDPIRERYEVCRANTEDIREHLPILRDLASECEHVTEFGVRNGDGSTVAFLAGQPETLISYDLNPWAIVNQSLADLLAAGAMHPDGRWRVGRTFFQPRTGDTLTMPVIEPTDLLFIDTFHVARQLQAELVRHADPTANTVRRFLVFHDTVTFGMKGEDGSEPGLRAAIRWFQRCHAFPVWELLEDRQNNNGLVILHNVRNRS